MSILRWLAKLLSRTAAAIYVLALKTYQLPRVWRETKPQPISDEIVRPASGNLYAIAVRFPLLARDDGFPALLESLARRNVNVIVVCNGRCEPAHMDELRANAQRVIVRANVGRDFGAYRAATLQLYNGGVKPERLLYFNDSLIYLPGPELDRMVDELIDRPAAFVGTFENHEREHHVCSFAFSLSGRAATDPAMQRFWRDYRPYDVRPHAIRKGEIALTRRIKSRGYDLDIIYSSERIAALLDGMSMAELMDAQRLLPGPQDASLFAAPSDTRKRLTNGLSNPTGEASGARLVDARNLGTTSPEAAISAQRMIRDSLVNRTMGSFLHSTQVHFGFGLFYRLMHCPIVKKDLLSRGIYLEHEVARVLGDLPEADALRLVRQLSSRGRPVNLTAWRHFLLHNGLI